MGFYKTTSGCTAMDFAMLHPGNHGSLPTLHFFTLLGWIVRGCGNYEKSWQKFRFFETFVTHWLSTALKSRGVWPQISRSLTANFSSQTSKSLPEKCGQTFFKKEILWKILTKPNENILQKAFSWNQKRHPSCGEEWVPFGEPLVGFEPTTPRLQITCSGQLS